jgi:hypothetical protein
MKNPVSVKTGWQDDVPSGPAEQVSSPGKHHLADFVATNAESNAEKRAKTLRDLGGPERDRRRIPPRALQTSGRSDKSSSRVRIPSEAFRRNLDLIDWSR